MSSFFRPLFAGLLLMPASVATAQTFTRQDTLRGSNGPGRNWWDVLHYTLSATFDVPNKSIKGVNLIRFKVTGEPHDSLQLDLQELMFLDRVALVKRNYYQPEEPVEDHYLKVLETVKDGHVFWVKIPKGTLRKGDTVTLQAEYHGKPRTAVRPPWDGGFIWTKDSNGKPWISVACQGLGASTWWPCKDDQGDEPDNGMDILLSLPDSLKLVSNGRYDDTSRVINSYNLKTMPDPAGEKVMLIASEKTGWHVRNPINSYNVTFYIGDYVHWSDTLMGEKGQLDLDFYVLRENEAKARKHFAVTKQMLHCFEYWMGPYPFYEDGYKLVEAPFLGMEHQSAVAYGNKYRMGYLGMDRSGTGVGMQFDYIIIHESGHEWFGNNITAIDQADNWIHEGFTTYSETLFAECLLGKGKARTYNLGERQNIDNDAPIIGPYGVNREGSGDMYDKGANMIHMIRTLMNDDEKFRQLLRGLGRDFYHQTVSTRQVEDYISRHSGLDLSAFFDQYLRTKDIPVLEWYRKGRTLHYRFTGTVPGFSLTLKTGRGKREKTLTVTNDWQSTSWHDKSFVAQDDFLIKVQEVPARQ